MDSEKNKAAKIKSSLAQTRKIIAEKFRKLHMNKISTERNLREKYAPLTDSLQQIISKEEEEEEVNRQQNAQNHRGQEIEFGDFDDFDEMPPPPFPPPPPPRYSQIFTRQNQRVSQRIPPPIPPRSRSRSPHSSHSPQPSAGRDSSRHFSLEPPSAPNRPKRPRSTTSTEDGMVFGRYKSEPKLFRYSYEPIEYNAQQENDINQQENDINEQENDINEQIYADIRTNEENRDGAWGGVNALSHNDLRQHDDDSYVEILRNPSVAKSNEFIANSLKINKKNRRRTNVLPAVQFAKIDRKRVGDKETHDGDDAVESDINIRKVMDELTKKKMDALNEDKWTDADERKYQDIVAIMSPNDFDETGKFIGTGEKRRKVELALKKFNKESIRKIKSREKSVDRLRKGRGFEKNFIPYSQNIVYEYWDDPNELCERLQLLLASKSAGNSNHDQEINSIIEELKERDIIE